MIIGCWKIGDFEFGENIWDSLHLVTKNVQNLVKTKGQNKVIFWVIFFYQIYNKGRAHIWESRGPIGPRLLVGGPSGRFFALRASPS